MITVFVDTTATFPDVMFSRTRWMQLLSLCARNQVAVVISEVVLRETARHWETSVSKSIDDLSRARASIDRSLRKLRDFDIDINLETLRDFQAPPVEQQDFIGRAQSRLEELGVEVRSLPNVTIEDLLQRDLSKRRPFSDTGKGFRDALVWETLKEVVDQSTDGDVVFFVTGNTSDYCEDGALHASLIAEVTGNGDLRHVKTLNDLMQALEVQPLLEGLAKTDAELADYLKTLVESDYPDFTAPTIGEAVRRGLVNAANGLIDEDVRTENETTTGLNFTGLGIPSQMESASISWIDPAEETVDWQTYETYDGGTLLVRGEIDADISVQGFVYKSDYYGLEDGVELVDWEWNEHMAQVVATRRARLIFQMRVEPGADLVEDYEFDGVESLDPAEH